jgi:RNA polymerase sigma-70 factor (ECF subfamily)
LDKEFDLVRKILDGDQRKFEQIITLYERLVTHIVFRMVSDDLDREEICQEVFIKVYQNLSGFNFNAKLSTWIAKIAHNHCINYLRKHKLNLLDDISKPDDNSEIQFTESLHTQSSSPDTESEQKDRKEIIKKEIEKLPEKYKIILTLYHIDELSYKDIGEITDMPEGTVKSYLFRARKILRESLLKTYRGEEIWQ